MPIAKIDKISPLTEKGNIALIQGTLESAPKGTTTVVVACRSGVGVELGRGIILNEDGEFAFPTRWLEATEHDIVVRHLERDGSFGDNRSWSMPYRYPVHP
jgi:hypothetical protein